MEKNYPGIEYSLSFPRLKTIKGEDFACVFVDDATFVKVICLTRILFPRIGINLSTREKPQLRNRVLGLGITRMSAGSNTAVGGYTLKAREDQDISFRAQAQMLEAFCDSMDVDSVDLVGNDSGGAIAQIFAARHPQQIRSLTLTNCDTHDNYPPPAFAPTRAAAAAGRFSARRLELLADMELSRPAFAAGYEHVERVSTETLRAYLEPLFATPEATRNLERWLIAEDDNSPTVEIEPLLRQLRAPTLIVWGTADVFFPLKWAYWLKDTIPGARKVIELDDAKIFFPEERPDALVQALREHWRV